MTIWDVLGIEPTADKVEIRRAYSAMLKLHRPDEDPEGYQMLRWAYEAALVFAKSPEIPHSAVMEGETAWEEPEESLPEAVPEKRTPTTKEKIDEFIGEVKALYDDFTRRIDIAQWEELLKREVLSDVGAHEQIAKQMLDVLSQRHHFPREIWRLLESHFHWATESTGYELRFQDLIRYIDRQVSIGLTGTQYRRLDPVKAESYLADLELLTPIGELFDREECERRVGELTVRYPVGDEIYILEQLYYYYYIKDANEKNYLRVLSLANLERCLTILRQLVEIVPNNPFFLLETITLCIKTDQPSLADEYYKLALESTQEATKDRVKAWYSKELLDHAKNNRTVPVGHVAKNIADAVSSTSPVNDTPVKVPSKRSFRGFMNSKHSIWLLLAIIGSTVRYINRLNQEAAMILLAILVGGYIVLKTWAKKT